MPENFGHIKTRYFQTADSFLEALSPTGSEYGKSYFPNGWYFRGHANAEWELVPGIFRSAFNRVGEWTKGTLPTNLRQVACEAALLLAFVDTANRVGMHVADNLPILRSKLLVAADAYSPELRKQLLAGERWPADELLPIVSLAQHYGLATRLLDWSRSAYIAAYFAASQAAQWCFKSHSNQRGGATHLCVWAISKDIFGINSIMLSSEDRAPRITEAFPPSAPNANLRAQKGLFLVDRPAFLDPDSPPDARPWDRIIREDTFFWEDNPDVGLLERLCLTIEEAPRLLRLLSFQEVDAASIFPGHGGVVMSLDERKYWESPSNFHNIKNIE